MATITKFPANGFTISFANFDGQYTSPITATSSQFSWLSDEGDSYTVIGQLSYTSGIPDANSQIAQVVIDADNDGLVEFNIAFDTFQPIMDSLISGDNETFWRSMLGGSDRFDLTGPSQSTFTSSFVGGDGITVLDTEILVAQGDTFNVTGGFRDRVFGDFINIDAGGTLTGGDDVVSFFGELNQTKIIYLDVGTAYGALTGGNDSVSFTASAAGSTSISILGDSSRVGSSSSSTSGATVIGGNDTVDASGTAFRITFFGDAEDVFTTLEGGDDMVTLGTRTGTLYGDAERLDDGNSGTGFYFIGGDDTLIGGSGNDFIYGDYKDRELGYTNVTGGNDLLSGGAGFDQLFGNEGNDTLSGGSDDDTLNGGAGDDSILGNTGADLIDAGDGNDTINGGASADTLTFENSFFALNLTLANNGVAFTTNTGQGTDTISNVENIIGTNVGDNITGNNLYNVLEGGGGNDTLDGGTGLDTASYVSATAGVTVSLALQGSAQNTGAAGLDTLNNFERLTGSLYGDTLTGDAGNNIISLGSGSGTDFTLLELEVADGGDGIDTLSFADYDAISFGVEVDLSLQGTEQVIVDLSIFDEPSFTNVTGLFSNFEYLTGSIYSDRLTGDDNYNRINGGRSNDFMTGGGGFDDFDGGDGFDTVDYSAETAALTANLVTELATFAGGDENLVSIENIYGSQGATTVIGNDDRNTVYDVGNSDDSFDGGLEIDTYSYEGASTGVSVYLQFTGRETGAGKDTLINVENVTGSEFGDRLIGDSNDNSLSGGDGNDTIKAKDGDNTLRGDAGNDFIRGSAGEDNIRGGAGNDTLFGLSGNDRISDNGTDVGGIDYAYGGQGDDIINLSGGQTSVIRGNRGDDYIVARSFEGGANFDLRGGGGNDTIEARNIDGSSYITGGLGNDRIGEFVGFSVASNDVLSGGNGGAGGKDNAQDVFVFVEKSGTVVEFDRIKDFEDGIDKIDLVDYDFTDFNTDVLPLAMDNAFGDMEITFATGTVVIVENFTVAEFTFDDVILA